MTFLSIGGSETETIVIDQISSPHNYKVIAPLRADEYVHNLKIVVRGSINDTAMIGNVKLLAGKVNKVIYNSDWYSPDYELRYKPYKAIEGSLKVDLTFSYLN
ncbi:hypothetical protein GWO68_02650 [Pontibacter sp. BT213]|uniref:Uncharacterized protein n=2 Tax=Pontibacter fetidus TaxID=2700082 RepID=A0A6B2H2G0_9BACT|nr:hypothetical protein [Pontibacter fetidus]